MTINQLRFNVTMCGLLFFFTPYADAKPQTATKASAVSHAEYDPLKVADAKIKTLELKIKDTARNREFPVLVYLPKSQKPSAVIIHSHGLGGQKETSPFLGKHWAARGFVAVFLQHPGSDDSVWQGVPRQEIMAAFKKAASAENLALRTGDVAAAIDQLEKWNREDKHPLYGRLDLKHIGMSGHSFGAVTTQHVGGQANYGRNTSDPRISAAIPMSPSLPRAGNPSKAFQAVKIPWLCMTGTKDGSPIGDVTPESRQQVYQSLPAGDKYELVLHNAQHSAFTESALRKQQRMADRNPNHHPAIKAITTAFWDTYLREDESAKDWIESDSVKKILEPKDRWQSK